MKKLIISFILLLSVTVFAQTEKFGKELTLADKTNISDILLNPSEFEGKTVLVEGEILDVCPMAGCWMELKGDAGNQKIKVKVKDGEIVFPVEAKGKTALVEGTVYKIELTQEEAVEYYQHQAEEKGVEFDPSTVTGPVTIYQIKGLGAEIK
ncbi:MAG: DUF4920 domain-containing protein [Ignavibacteriaceae bacterium]|nr:DUF4920 domain-containing protein [Ignavibacteriaceae bacterium]